MNTNITPFQAITSEPDTPTTEGMFPSSTHVDAPILVGTVMTTAFLTLGDHVQVRALPNSHGVATTSSLLLSCLTAIPVQGGQIISSIHLAASTQVQDRDLILIVILTQISLVISRIMPSVLMLLCTITSTLVANVLKMYPESFQHHLLVSIVVYVHSYLRYECSHLISHQTFAHPSSLTYSTPSSGINAYPYECSHA